jgi:sulfate adenylyltransferase subunit 1
MAAALVNPAVSLDHFLLREGEKTMLRFSTAGSVDDGKSTLIGRLLYDTKGAFDDQIEAIKKSPINRSTGAIDFSLLTDGLKAEREQGITIDVAYRYFSTPARKFIIADTPGHEQYTRNMATGASTSDVAVILVDARKGVLPQSRRHACISALLGIRHLVIAINKMDLVDFREEIFESIRGDFDALGASLGQPQLTYIPLSALDGDNVVTSSERTPWYRGPSLLEYLERVEVGASTVLGPVRLPVQIVIRPHLDFRGFAGQLASGTLRLGDPLIAVPSGRISRVKQISTFDGELDEAVAPMSITVCLEDEIDISRGDLLASPDNPPEIGRHLEAKLVWMSDIPLEPGTPYLLQHGPHQVTARITTVRHRLDMQALKPQPATSLALNDIGLVVVETTRPLAFDPYRDNRRTGAFILIDPLTNLTLGAGMIERRVFAPVANGATERLRFLTGPVTSAERAERFHHRGFLVSLERRPEVAEVLERTIFELGGNVLIVRRPLNPVDALLDAGLLVISLARQESRPESTLDAGALSLPEDPEEASRHILSDLRARGVITATDQFRPGEGI